MSMRVFDHAGLIGFLEAQYECDQIDGPDENMIYMATSAGMAFVVPECEDSVYPEFMVDSLVKKHKLEKRDRPRLRQIAGTGTDS